MNNNFDWDLFKKGSIAVFCNTREKNDEFLREAANHDIEVYDNYERYLEHTCYRCDNYNSLMYCSELYYELNGFTIIEWNEFPNLKEGMVIKTRDGQKFYIRNHWQYGLIASGEKTWIKCNAYDNELYYLKNLEDLQLKELDIMEIYDTDSVNMENLFADDDLRLIWEREPAEEMTLKEVCEALGKKIKIKED